MGKRYSGRRPEDQPIHTKPNQLDFEKRSIILTSVSRTFRQVINTIIEEKEAEDGMILDGGDSLCDVTDTSAIVIDLGDST